MRPLILPVSLALAGFIAGGLVRWRSPNSGSIACVPCATEARRSAKFAPNVGRTAPAVAAHSVRHERVLADVVRCIESDSDYEAAVRAVDGTGTDLGRGTAELLEMVEALRRRNLDWAANFALALPAGAARYAAIEIVAEEFVGRDPRQALEWAQFLPPGITRSIALERIVGRLTRSDPILAADGVAALPPSLARDDAMSSLASHWARQDPAQALAWLQSLPEGPVRPRVIGSVGFELAQLEPAAVLRLIANIESGDDRALLLASVRWSRIQPSPKSELPTIFP